MPLMIRNLHWMLPAAFIFWNALSLALLVVAGERLSVTATNWLSLAYVVYLPALPILRPLGLVVDAYWPAPKMGGVILVGIFYCLILFGIGKLVQRLWLVPNCRG